MPFPSLPAIEKMYRQEHLAELLGVSVATLTKWRHLRRGGPRWITLGARTVAYPESAIVEYLSECASHPQPQRADHNGARSNDRETQDLPPTVLTEGTRA